MRNPFSIEVSAIFFFFFLILSFMNDAYAMNEVCMNDKRWLVKCGTHGDDG